MIKEGDKVPEFTFLSLVEGKPSPKTTKDLFDNKKVVLLSIPGAFTPTCTKDHCPGFAREADQLLKAGVDAVYCTAVNDPFVLDAFADYLKAKGKITFLSDNGDFAKSIGLEKNIPQVYMGLRTKRYAMVVENHIIKYLGVDEQGLDKSSAESVLKFLSK